MPKRVLFTAVSVAFAALALSACAGGGGGAAPTVTVTVEPTPTASADPTPSAAAAVLPTGCDAVGTAATRAATVDQMTEQGDAAQFTRPVPPGATLALGCNWIEGDATGYLLLISEADAAAAQSYAESTLPGEGFACQVGDNPAYICTQTLTGSVEPVDTVETIYIRDGVWIYQAATNTDGETLLSELVASIWSS